MPKRTLAVLVAAAFGALALPFGMPSIAHAAGTYTSISIKPLPLEQPGTLNPSGTNSVTACVQPLNAGKVVAGASVFLSIDNGLFTAPHTTTTGTAFVGATQLTATPTSFVVQATCTWVNNEGTGPLMDAIPVTYTGPNPILVHGRDVIAAQSNTTSFDPSTGLCLTTAGIICSTATYVFSPVAQYQVSAIPIAPAGTLAAGATATFTVTALDNSTPTPQPVPGAFLDLSLSSAALGGGTATAFNNFPPGHTGKINNTPNRFGTNASGQVVVTYTAANPLPANGMDTITVQDHPAFPTVTATTSYTYTGTLPAFAKAPYSAVTPFRVCDTRPAGGGVPSNQCNTGSTGGGTGPITQGASRVITVDGFGGLPGSGVTAVVLNVAAIAPSQGTFLTLYPDGGSRPGTSNLNPPAGAVISNLVEVAVSAAGKVDVFNDLGSTNVALDIEGYTSAGSTGLFNPVVPTRICDTRAVGGGVGSNQCNSGPGSHPIGPGGVLTFDVNKSGSPLPTSGVAAVVFNLSAISPTTRTVLTAYPGPASNPRPNAANININPGTAVPNRVIVPVPAGCNSTTGCTVNIWNSLGFVNVAVDIGGWFGTATGAQFTAIPPARVCDVRSGNVNVDGCTRGVIAPGHILTINVTGVDGIGLLGGAHTPVAIVANISAANATSSTFVTVYPGPLSASRPNASDLNAPNFLPVTNLVVVKVGSDGTINLFNDLGNVNLIVDVLGYYS
jgi:hypothetical protein